MELSQKVLLSIIDQKPYKNDIYIHSFIYYIHILHSNEWDLTFDLRFIMAMNC